MSIFKFFKRTTINGEVLKNIRENSNITREELANLIYVTPYIIQSWEEGWGIMNPSSGEISGMAEIFNMTEDDLREKINASEENDYE